MTQYKWPAITTLVICLSIAWLYSASKWRGPPSDFQNSWGFARAVVSACTPHDSKCRDGVLRAQAGYGPVGLGVVEPPNLFVYFWWSTKFSLSDSLAVWRGATIVLLIFALVASIKLLTNVRPKLGPDMLEPLWLFVIFANFPPAIYDIQLGQISAVVSAGLVLFCLLREDTPLGAFARGLALTLTFVKPNLLYLLYLWVGIDALRRRKAGLILGLMAGTALNFTPAMYFQPNILRDFWTAISHYSTSWMRATAGTWFRIWFSTHSVFLDYLLLTVGLTAVGVIASYHKRMAAFAQLELFLVTLPILSVCTTPYVLPYDFVVLIPSIIWIFFMAGGLNRWLALVVRICLVALNQISFLYFTEMHYFAIYPWILLGLYFICRVSHEERRVEAPQLE